MSDNVHGLFPSSLILNLLSKEAFARLEEEKMIPSLGQ